jgi:hypothetical protein
MVILPPLVVCFYGGFAGIASRPITDFDWY